METTRLFLALQCVQCATMQVKQQKKSNNKWVCVVCNQRQSVLHVHARGYRAADLRRFVQDANLARGRREFAPLAEPDVGWDPAAVDEQGDVLPIEKRQTEWSEFLDDPGEPGNGCGGLGADVSDGESGEGIDVITELPQKRPKVRPLKAQLDVGKRTKLSTHPTLYNKRQQIKQGSSPRCATTTAEVQRSKSSLFGERKGSDTTGLHWIEHDESASTSVLSFHPYFYDRFEHEIRSTDVVVEDEVHPDFI